ncbi:MAG TPA: DUF4012 domain-containing protein [Ktedonobacteraceae bacterium]|nr:DUF4012 domain-containing protein [Ktedonobacteraceae bacterium]
MEHKETLSKMHDMPTEPAGAVQSSETEPTRLEDAETVQLEAAPPSGASPTAPATVPTKEQPRRRHWLKKSVVINSLLLCALLLFDTSVAAFGFQTVRHYYADYQHYLAVARSGIQHLQTAEKDLAAYPQNPLDNQQVILAQREFSAAQANFTQLSDGLKALPGALTAVPVYGARLNSALRVVPLALEVTKAGLIGCDILNLLTDRFHTMLATKSQSLTATDIDAVRANLQQLKQIFSLVSSQVDHLSPADLQLDPRLGKLVAAFHQYVPVLLTAFDDIGTLLPVIPTLLGIGNSTNYLIEIMDISELRPGGGFIGNYGILTVLNGRQVAAHITDVDLLDKPFEAAGNVIPFPPAYQWFDIANGNWGLRDTNLDADFPTVARYSEQNYIREGGQTHFEGVIAITPTLIQNLLTVTGPIAVPEYHETITAQNLTDRIHYYQLGSASGSDVIAAADGKSSQRKHFTAVLAEHFIARFRQIPVSNMGSVIQIITKALRTKDIQIYFNSPVAESFLQHFDVDSAIQAPNSDSLFIVDANIAASKANQFMIDKLDDQVTLDAQGNALHTTKISYAWTIPGPIYGNATYRDYARIYVPPGSVLQSQDGWQTRGTSKAFGRTVWAGFFTMTFGQTRVITLHWLVPKAATKDATGWHYAYLLQHQAGTRWSVDVHITLPTCALVKHTSAPLKPDSNQSITASAYTLDEDTTMNVDYTGCSS